MPVCPGAARVLPWARRGGLVHQRAPVEDGIPEHAMIGPGHVAVNRAEVIGHDAAAPHRHVENGCAWARYCSEGVPTASDSGGSVNLLSGR